MIYSYRGKNYRLDLTNEGKIACPDLGIEKPTADEVKNAIRLQIDAESDPKKRIKILTFGHFYSYQGESNSVYYEGQTTGIEASRGQYWVSWKNGNQTHRAKLSTGQFFLDTPANRKILDKVCASRIKREKLEEQEDALLEKVERFQPQK